MMISIYIFQNSKLYNCATRNIFMFFDKRSELSMMVFMIALLIMPIGSGFDLYFNASGTQYANISVSYSALDELTFSITGLFYNNSYPTNITVDVGNDGVSDWEYNVFESNVPIQANQVLNAWSTNIGDSSILFLNMSSGLLTAEMLPIYGTLISSNDFVTEGNILDGATLGIEIAPETASPIVNQQIVSIVTNESTIHAFIPLFSVSTSAGFYVAQGGSTYYCNTNHNLTELASCNLSTSEAMISEHLLRAANITQFDYTEPVRNPNSAISINKLLKNCSLPCNIPIKVEIQGAGGLTLDNFNMIESVYYPPANITLLENVNDYSITIQNNTALQDVRYFYGVKPDVYIIPFEAQNEVRGLSANQVQRLNIIQNNIVQVWDNMTNKSHPLNFILYTNRTPIKITGFTLGENYSELESQILNNSPVNASYPSILVMLDVWDYFQYKYPTTRQSTGQEDGFISIVYLNGLNNASSTTLENYNNEIMMNVLLHEITHTFMGYPPSILNNERLFYTAHPANFRDGTEFSDVYGKSLSSTGREGYFDIYSIMNSVRIYLLKSELGNRIAELSLLDKMLLGIFSPDLGGNYTFYEGNITLQGNKFVATSMIVNATRDLKQIYKFASDSNWWDVRTDSTSINANLSKSFNISKQNQNNSALWVFATDLSNQNHFKVFNNNARSSYYIVSGPAIDTSAPNSISNLRNISSGTSWIYVNWTNPVSDFYNALIYLNSVNIINISNNFYNFTGLSANTLYNISVRTKDSSGNVNTTFVSITARTLIDLCTNGVQDGSETGVDCGGSCAATCSSGSTSSGGSGGGGGGGGGSSGANTQSTNTTNATNQNNSILQTTSNPSNLPNTSNANTGNITNVTVASNSLLTGRAIGQIFDVSRSYVVILIIAVGLTIFLLINIVRKVRKAHSVGRIMAKHFDSGYQPLIKPNPDDNIKDPENANK